MDPVVLLSFAVLVLTLATSILAASVPMLWWLHLRSAARQDEMQQDINKLDEVTTRLCRAAGLEERK